MHGEIKLLSGSQSHYLKNKIAKYLDMEPAKCEVSRFKDGEIRVQIKESIRGDDVFIIQSTQPPADNLMELLLLIDAAKRASASRVTAVIPYFGYARQDRKDQPRVPISAKLVANLIQTAGADRVITLDLHADQIQGFFDIPVDNLYASPIFKKYFTEFEPETHMIVAPDVGATKRARLMARHLGNLPLALVDKRRPAPNSAEVVNIIGDVSGMKLLIVDDIIDTGNTIAVAAQALIEAGAAEIRVAATHGLFSDGAKEKLDNAPIEEIVITNSLPVSEDKRPRCAIILDVAPLLGEAILRTHEERSVSALFI
ncbi:MAG: ribose-phosphate pyrophosphokinase [Candidatus Hydrothermota bacterium]|nr:MAG: ribose-phosphate pyrophosphokinase [Candidatus Hydrothermae bacterium]